MQIWLAQAWWNFYTLPSKCFCMVVSARNIYFEVKGLIILSIPFYTRLMTSPPLPWYYSAKGFLSTKLCTLYTCKDFAGVVYISQVVLWKRFLIPEYCHTPQLNLGLTWKWFCTPPPIPTTTHLHPPPPTTSTTTHHHPPPTNKKLIVMLLIYP